MDSAPQSNRGCRCPDHLHRILCPVIIFITPSRTITATIMLYITSPNPELTYPTTKLWTSDLLHLISWFTSLFWKNTSCFSEERIYSIYTYIYIFFNYYMSENMFVLSLHLTDRLLKHSVTWKSLFSHNHEGTAPLSLSFPYCCWYKYWFLFSFLCDFVFYPYGTSKNLFITNILKLSY